MAGTWLSVGALLGLIGVAAGAFGAHALKGRLGPDALVAYETAVRYQMYHAFALIATAWVISQQPSRAAFAAAICFLVGVLFFSGSLYGLTLAGWKWLGPVTPLGGLILMVGWLLLAVSAWGMGKG